MQETLDVIIVENKSAAIRKRTILHTLSIIRDITDMSKTLNKQLPVISLEFFSQGGSGFYFSALHIFGYEDKFIHLIQVGYTNIQSKIKINGSPI